MFHRYFVEFVCFVKDIVYLIIIAIQWPNASAPRFENNILESIVNVIVNILIRDFAQSKIIGPKLAAGWFGT